MAFLNALWETIYSVLEGPITFFKWDYVWEILPWLMRGVVITIEATILAFLLALVLGLVLALLRRSRIQAIRWAVIGFVEFVRSTPLLVQLYFMFFVLPNFGVTLAPFPTGVITFGLHYAAYASEVYRAGFDGIPKGQWEACTALNMSRYRTYRNIVIPQAIPPVVPALGNYLVALFKETSLLSAIGVLELMQTAKIIGSETFRYLEPVTLVGVFYLVLSLLSATLIGQTELWLKRKIRR